MFSLWVNEIGSLMLEAIHWCRLMYCYSPSMNVSPANWTHCVYTVTAEGTRISSVEAACMHVHIHMYTDFWPFAIDDLSRDHYYKLFWVKFYRYIQVSCIKYDDLLTTIYKWDKPHFQAAVVLQGTEALWLPFSQPWISSELRVSIRSIHNWFMRSCERVTVRPHICVKVRARCMTNTRVDQEKPVNTAPDVQWLDALPTSCYRSAGRVTP